MRASVVSALVKPYAKLPDYADVEYVDGKLKVARGIVSRTQDFDLRRRWLETIDILLDQRAALVSLAEVISGVIPPDIGGAKSASGPSES